MQKRLNHLIGADLVMLHFAGDMSMWGFSGSSFSSQLHVQCSYRLTYSNKNLLCQSDVFTIVNPNDNENISTCSIKVSYNNNRIKVEELTSGGSCPTQADYDK